MSDPCRRWSPSGSRPSRPLFLLLALALASGLTSCGGGAKPKTAALQPPPSLPQTAVTPPAEAGAAQDPPPPPAPEPTPRPQKPPKKPETLIFIEPPEEPKEPPTLAEAAARAREERREGNQVPMVTITNDNLSEYATGQVTMMEGKGTEGTAEAGEDPLQALARDEEYWRQGVRELRLHLRRAADESVELEQQVAGLRLRFYAEDDPYVRDGQVKPAWDRALERQRQVETELKAYRRELEEFLENGRRAGALPGWLREGIELEPAVEEEPAGEEEQPGDLSRHYPSSPESQPPAEPPR